MQVAAAAAPAAALGGSGGRLSNCRGGFDAQRRPAPPCPAAVLAFRVCLFVLILFFGGRVAPRCRTVRAWSHRLAASNPVTMDYCSSPPAVCQ